MNRSILLSIFLLLTGFVLAFVYADYGNSVYSVIFRWGEVIITLSLFAGLFKVLYKEMTKIKRGKLKEWNSAVILISFILTFLAGVLNFNESKYTFNNIVRERPSYLIEISDIIIGDDYYLSKFPARKKLGLYLSANVTSNFYPTSEMLRDAGVTNDEFNDLRFGRTPFSKGDKLFFNPDDIKLISDLEEKTRNVSIETISIMLPVSEKLRGWFIDSVEGLGSKAAVSDLKGYEKLFVPDLIVNNVTFEESGNMLKKWFSEQMEKRGAIEINEEEMILHYTDFITVSGVSQVVAEKYSVNLKHGLSKNAVADICSAFLRTGVTSSPKMKGFIRWIYRSVFDPLLSTFMTLLFFSMMLTAYRKLNFRNYSYFVISLSVCMVIIGLFPYFSASSAAILPNGWSGPFSENWLMNTFASPVFKSLAIGTGAGFMFYAVETVYDTFSSMKKGEKRA